LDASCTLALLQEEALEPGHRRDFKKSDSSVFSKTATIKGALPMPPPAPRPTDDKKQGGRGASVDDRLSALRNFRKARGLCIRCGDKWAPGHKCPTELQLHALQEVWNLCQEDFQDEEPEPTSPDESEHQAFMLLSAAALSGSAHPRTLQLRGSLAGHEVLILVDSGSSHSFLSSATASKIPGCVPLRSPVTVTVADGGFLSCDSELPMAEWTVQGHSFHSALKILPLRTFDMIIGMDWLDAFSPMKVHWRHKWMVIPYGPTTVQLQGISSEPEDATLFQLFQADASSVSAHPALDNSLVQSVLDDFADLFAEPSELPPRRACDHRIPLLPGAQPVAVRSYDTPLS
jgi:hypothetical protein